MHVGLQDPQILLSSPHRKDLGKRRVSAPWETTGSLKRPEWKAQKRNEGLDRLSRG